MSRNVGDENLSDEERIAEIGGRAGLLVEWWQESHHAARSRVALWVEFLRAIEASRVAEIGVYKGAFAAQLLAECESICSYYMVDPWRHLDDWNKPANRDDDQFTAIYAEAMARTEFAAAKRVVLRGRTTEVIDQVPDGSLDFIYVDGDHTLRGVAIDLICAYPKVRPGGWIGGDDFTGSVWQHDSRYEPTFVFPFAVYFAEAAGAPVFGLPFRQFLMQKPEGTGTRFKFKDLTGTCPGTSLRGQVYPRLSRRMADLLRVRGVKRRLRERFALILKL